MIFIPCYYKLSFRSYGFLGFRYCGYFYLFIWSSGVLFSWSSGLGLPDQLDEQRHHRDNLSCQLKLIRQVLEICQSSALNDLIVKFE